MFRSMVLSPFSGLKSKMRGKNDGRYREGREVIETANKTMTKINYCKISVLLFHPSHFYCAQ
jgi:hypothetical protein